MWKRAEQNAERFRQWCFSPLAGIRYVETHDIMDGEKKIMSVSVPLRGLDMWKQFKFEDLIMINKVSVPLRGLDMWKPKWFV